MSKLHKVKRYQQFVQTKNQQVPLSALNARSIFEQIERRNKSRQQTPLTDPPDVPRPIYHLNNNLDSTRGKSSTQMRTMIFGKRQWFNKRRKSEDPSFMNSDNNKYNDSGKGDRKERNCNEKDEKCKQKCQISNDRKSRARHKDQEVILKLYEGIKNKKNNERAQVEKRKNYYKQKIKQQTIQPFFKMTYKTIKYWQNKTKTISIDKNIESLKNNKQKSLTKKDTRVQSINLDDSRDLPLSPKFNYSFSRKKLTKKIKSTCSRYIHPNSELSQSQSRYCKARSKTPNPHTVRSIITTTHPISSIYEQMVSQVIQQRYSSHFINSIQDFNPFGLPSQQDY